MKKLLCCIFAFIIIFNISIPTKALNISAAASVVINGDTGEVLYAHNADERLPMASTTKIMTALLLCEYGDLDREITVTKEMVTVEGSSMGLLPGDTVSLRGLLYGMLLPSGNDAANTTAILIDGSVKKFAERMNKRAKKMGLQNTNFVTPSGLDAKEHYTTARELALIAREAMKNKDFAKAASSEYQTLYYGNPPYRRTLKNHNKLLGDYEGLIGVKTGYTKKSGRCLVTAAKRGEEYVIAVTLKAADDWNAHRALLDYGFDKLQSFVLDEGQIFTLFSANKNSNTINLKSEKTVFVGETADGFKQQIILPAFYYDVIKQGEKVGEILYYKDDELKLCVDICAENSSDTVSVNKFLEIKNIFLYIISFI